MKKFADCKTAHQNLNRLCAAFIMALLYCCMPADAFADKAAAKMFEKAINKNKSLSAATIVSVFEMEYSKGEFGQVWGRYEITAASRIENGKLVEVVQTRVNPGYETVNGEKISGFTIDYLAWDQTTRYHWHYNPYVSGTPRETVKESKLWHYFRPVDISQTLQESNDNTIKYIEEHGEVKGDSIVLASEAPVTLAAHPVSNLKGVIKFDKEGRVASFEASGNVPIIEGLENDSHFTYSSQLTYEFAPRQPAFSDVGVINLAARDQAQGFYKAIGPDGAELPYNCQMPPLPSPLVEIGLVMAVKGNKSGQKADYTINRVEPLTPQARPGYFLGDAAQSIEKFDAQYNYIWLGSNGYGCTPETMALVWDKASGEWVRLPKLDEGIKDMGKFYCVVDKSNQMKLMIQQHDKYMP